MSRGYIPNERIVKRAAQVWMEMLGAPKYDNLGPNSPESPESKFRNGIASTMAASLPKNNTPEVLQRFGEELTKIMLKPFKFTAHDGTEHEYQAANYLTVDYHPDAPLREAAKRAGLEMQFPWKTSMFLEEDYLSVSAGYGAPSVYHYPLQNDRWLVTRLNGPDIGKIIELVEAGFLDLELRRADGV